MKQITLDFETYQKELKDSYEKGKTQGSNLLSRAVDLIDKVSHQDYTLKTSDLYLWLNDYQKQTED